MLNRYRHAAPQSRLTLLRSVPMFAHLSDRQLRQLDSMCCEMRIPAGKRLMTQGEIGREAFVIVSGNADVEIDGRPVAIAERGDVLGEMALLDDGPRSATVTAISELDVIVLDRGQFAVLMADPHVARGIAAALSRRLRRVAAPASAVSGDQSAPGDQR
jgi:CRP/FNR family transcriptional regulator, cyclic AMP receptor protein